MSTCVQYFGAKRPTPNINISGDPFQSRRGALPPPHSKRQQRSALRLQEFQEKKRAAAVQDFVTQGADPVVAQEKVPTFALGILTQSLQNLGFEAAPKERMMLTARLPLRNGDHPSQDSLRKLKKWRPPWRFLFS